MTRPISTPVALALVLAAMSYQLGLCFLNTHGVGISNAMVAAVEATILFGAGVVVLPHCGPGRMIVLLGVLGYFALLWLFRQEVAPKELGDVLIMLTFYWIGRHLGNRQAANQIVWVISLVVMAVGAIEYAFVEQYTKVFNVLQYYAARGLVSSSTISIAANNLFVSGMRPGGRWLLPFLGDQRVSSIFIEPVSMGNYAALVAAWGLSFDRREWRQALGHLGVAVLLIIASDSRFAGMMLVALLILRLTPGLAARPLLTIAPLAVVAGLLADVAIFGDITTDDDLPGRLLRCGQMLAQMDIAQIVGIGANPDGLSNAVRYGDAGLPYSLVSFGIVLAMALWGGLVLLRVEDRRAALFKAMLAVFCLALLSISGTSFFSSKFAALAWLLMGALGSAPAQAPEPAGSWQEAT
jgi:putative polymerase